MSTAVSLGPATAAARNICSACSSPKTYVLRRSGFLELWRRFTITLRRTLAHQSEHTGKAFTAQALVPTPRSPNTSAAGSSTSTRSSASTPHRTGHYPACLGHPRPAHRRHRPGRPHRPRRDPRRTRTDRKDSGVGPRTRHPPSHHHGGPDRFQGRRVRGQVRHQGRGMHRHPRPPHHSGRPARRAARPRPPPATHRRMPAPGRPRRPGRPPPCPVGSHARLPRPLLHQESPLLHHPRHPPRRSHRAHARGQSPPVACRSSTRTPFSRSPTGATPDALTCR